MIDSWAERASDGTPLAALLAAPNLPDVQTSLPVNQRWTYRDKKQIDLTDALQNAGVERRGMVNAEKLAVRAVSP